MKASEKIDFARVAEIRAEIEGKISDCIESGKPAREMHLECIAAMDEFNSKITPDTDLGNKHWPAFATEELKISDDMVNILDNRDCWRKR